MTRVYLKQGEKENIFIAKGHATGSVEVCAAVSTLTYSLYGYLVNSNIAFFSEINDGNAVITYDRTDESDTIFEFIKIGFLQLAKTEPCYISVSIEELT